MSAFEFEDISYDSFSFISVVLIKCLRRIDPRLNNSCKFGPKNTINERERDVWFINRLIEEQFTHIIEDIIFVTWNRPRMTSSMV